MQQIFGNFKIIYHGEVVRLAFFIPYIYLFFLIYLSCSLVGIFFMLDASYEVNLMSN